MQYDSLRHYSQSVHYIEPSYLEQDAATIDQMRRNQEQQTFTFNMITNVHFDHMGIYVEGTISEVRHEQA